MGRSRPQDWLDTTGIYCVYNLYAYCRLAMKTLTVFTPTYNRAHTLPRLYDSLKEQTCSDFEWLVTDDGSTDGTENLVREWISEGVIPIRYIYKENGGLYTGYNTAYANIYTELNVCIDSDDAIPVDAVEKIVRIWREKGSDKYAGITGLDYNLNTMEPIGRRFPEGMAECFFPELYAKRIHRGDSKQVMRTDLMNCRLQTIILYCLQTSVSALFNIRLKTVCPVTSGTNILTVHAALQSCVY